jgi:hypothetical protein
MRVASTRDGAKEDVVNVEIETEVPGELPDPASD